MSSARSSLTEMRGNRTELTPNDPEETASPDALHVAAARLGQHDMVDAATVEAEQFGVNGVMASGIEADQTEADLPATIVEPPFGLDDLLEEYPEPPVDLLRQEEATGIDLEDVVL